MMRSEVFWIGDVGGRSTEAPFLSEKVLLKFTLAPFRGLPANAGLDALDSWIGRGPKHRARAQRPPRLRLHGRPSPSSCVQ